MRLVHPPLHVAFRVLDPSVLFWVAWEDCYRHLVLICHFHSSMRPTVCHMLPGNQAIGKIVVMSFQDGKQENIQSIILTLRPPNFRRLSNLFAESKFPSKYTLNEKYLDSEVFDKITQNLSRIRSEALIGPRRSFIVLAIVYEWQTIKTKGRKGQMKTRWISNKTVNICGI